MKQQMGPGRVISAKSRSGFTCTNHREARYWPSRFTHHLRTDGDGAVKSRQNAKSHRGWHRQVDAVANTVPRLRPFLG